MTDQPSNPSEPPSGPFPEAPPFRPHYDKIVFIEGGRWIDPNPSLVTRLMNALGLLKPPKHPT